MLVGLQVKIGSELICSRLGWVIPLQVVDWLVMQAHLNPLFTSANILLAKASHMVKLSVDAVWKYTPLMREDIPPSHAKGLDVLHF